MTKFRHLILNEMSLSGLYKAIPESPLPVAGIIQAVRDDVPKCEQEFLKIFFCYRVASTSDIFCLGILSDAIKAGYLEISVEFISIPPQIDTSLKNIGGERSRIIESAEHQGMKIWAREFLRSKGIPATDEVSQLGYKVDVACLKKQIFVECGDTEPRKVFDFLRHKLTIGVLQYNSEEIVWFKAKDSFVEYANHKFLAFILENKPSPDM